MLSLNILFLLHRAILLYEHLLHFNLYSTFNAANFGCKTNKRVCVT